MHQTPQRIAENSSFFPRQISTVAFRLPLFICALLVALMQPSRAAVDLFSEFQGTDEDELISVIVTLHEADDEINALQSSVKGSSQNQQAALQRQVGIRKVIARQQDRALDNLDKRNYRLARQYSELPFLSLKVNRQGLQNLLSDPEISVSKVHEFRPLLSDSIPLILEEPLYDPTSSGNDNRGDGWTIALLDTGIDNANTFLGAATRIVSEACYSTLGGEPGSLVTACPGGVNDSITGAGTGVPCDISKYTECNHGTLAAGIAAGNGSAYDGVATASDLMSVNIYSYDLFTPGLLVAYEDDVLAGLERALVVHNLNNNINLSSVLLAFGAQAAELNNCDASYSSLKTAFDALKAAGIATVVAAGNDSFNSGINAPACISTAIAVGSSTKFDARSTFSNDGVMLDLYAPGQQITSSDIGNTNKISDGTSFAAAHVAGAWAVLKQASPGASVSQLTTVLQDTGVPVSGNTPSGAKRINLNGALAGIIPKLTLEKIVNNENGGSLFQADFPSFVDGVAQNWDVKGPVDPNVQHTASETLKPGYSASVWSGDCAADGTITLQPGDDKTCTITNTDDVKPTLTLVKTVVNDNGGLLDKDNFPSFVNGVAQAWDVQTGVVANVEHTVSETPQPGYTASVWGGDCAANGTITLLPGDDRTCTVTNDDIAPTLTLVKTVNNINGGILTQANFPSFVDGAPQPWDVKTDVEANLEHTASESLQPGYSAGVWGGDCAEDGTITLLPGDDLTCTITNTDAATLTLVKIVDNGDGGLLTQADFPSFVDGVAQAWDVKTETTPNVQHTVSENSQSGYMAGEWGGDCAVDGTITLLPGDNKTCTITNDDISPVLTILKVVENNNGGTALDTEFVLHLTGGVHIGSEPITSGDPAIHVIANTVYTLSEDPMAGYWLKSVICVDNTSSLDIGHPLTLSVGQAATCTISNMDSDPDGSTFFIIPLSQGGAAIFSL